MIPLVARLCLVVALGSAVSEVSAEIYSGPTQTDHPIDPAISASDSRFVEWANQIDPTRTKFAPRGSTEIDQSGGFNSLGDLSGDGSFFDSESNGILDTCLTDGSGGFDFRLGEGLGVGVIHTATAVPEPTGWAVIALLFSCVAVRRRQRSAGASKKGVLSLGASSSGVSPADVSSPGRATS